MEKLTKRVLFGEVAKTLTQGETLSTEIVDQLVETLWKEVAAMDRKSEKAKERAAQKRTEGDELTALVLDVITGVKLTGDEIAKALEAQGVEDVTKQKVVARLSAQVKAGKVAKSQESVEGTKRKAMHYTVISEDAVAEADAE